MITILSCTNRVGSKTLVVAKHYHDLLQSKKVNAQLFTLENLPHDFVFNNLYKNGSEEFQFVVEQFIEKCDKIVFVIPEYNGSFPGILKTFIDGIDPKHFKDKKAAIVGLSDGRAGNLRGQEHLTGILHYLKMHVHYSKPKLSSIEDLLDTNDQIIDPQSMKILEAHAQMFAAY